MSIQALQDFWTKVDKDADFAKKFQEETPDEISDGKPIIEFAKKNGFDFTEDELKSRGIDVITDEFDAQHDQLFSFKLGDGHEILMIRAVVKARAAEIAARAIGSAEASLEDCIIHQSKFYSDGAWHDAPLYDRSKLHTGIVVPGPAIVMEMDSTTVILPGHDAKVDTVGNLLINPTK